MEAVVEEGKNKRESPLVSVSRMELPPNYNATTQSRRRQQLRRDNFSKRKLQHGGDVGGDTIFTQVFKGDKTTTSSPSSNKVRHRKKTTSTRTAAATTATTNATLGSPQESQPLLGSNKPPPPSKKHHHHSHHSFLYSMLNPKSQRWQALAFRRFITTVIMSDMVLFIVSTDAAISNAHGRFFHVTEGVVSSIFLIEYIVRLVVIVEKQIYSDPFWGRLKYATTTTAAWIDFMSTAPFFLELMTGWDLPTLTILRMFRLFRILKMESYIRAVDAVYRVVYYNSEILYVAFLLCVFLTLFTSALLYFLRPRQDDTNFESIGATLYMSTLMLTGQGGPDGPLPWYTKCIVLLTSVFSVAMFSIPSSMLTWGFEAEAARMALQARRRALRQRSDRSVLSATSSSSSSEHDTTDEEYFKMIAGEDDESDSEEDEWMKKIRESFENADLDADGTLTLEEATEMIARNVAGGGASSAEVMSRMDQLEAKLNANNDKLDRILTLLQTR